MTAARVGAPRSSPYSSVRRSVLALAALCASTAASISVAQTVVEPVQNYPSRQIKIVVPFSPGGFTDVVARILSIKLGQSLGQTIIIDNRPGAGSTIGADLASKAAPDGYTLLMVSTTHVIGPFLYKSLPYDALKSFVPVGKMVEAPYVLVTNATVPASSVKDLVAYTKSKPGEVNYASSGNGSTQHLAGALFANMTQAPINHVPYRGSGQATADLVSGQVQMGFVGIPIAIQQVNAGRLKALAVTTDARSPQMPNVPTLNESGLTGYNASVWLGLLAPAGTPPEIVTRINSEVAKALAAPDTAKQLAEAGVEPTPSTPQAFGELLAAEYVKWGKVTKDTGATIN